MTTPRVPHSLPDGLEPLGSGAERAEEDPGGVATVAQVSCPDPCTWPILNSSLPKVAPPSCLSASTHQLGFSDHTQSLLSAQCRGSSTTIAQMPQGSRRDLPARREGHAEPAQGCWAGTRLGTAGLGCSEHVPPPWPSFSQNRVPVSTIRSVLERSAHHTDENHDRRVS